MPQSPSLISALSTVEQLLSAETGDLRELARIAGVTPEELYQGADLSGVNLTGQNIAFLLPLEVRFEEAIVSDSQMDAFKKAAQIHSRRRQKATFAERRIDKIRAFVEHYDLQRVRLSDRGTGPILQSGYLAEVVLDPFRRNRDLFAGNDGLVYAERVLEALAPWATTENLDFYQDLFTLLGEIGTLIAPGIIIPLSQYYLSTFGSGLGELLSLLTVSGVTDRWFVMDAAPEGQGQIFAKRLTSRRSLSPFAAKAFVEKSDSLSEIVAFLAEVPITIDDDFAEQIAFVMSRRTWHASTTQSVLEAKIPQRIFSALVRQIKLHPDQQRLAGLILWQNANKGAVGALSLDNLFGAFKDFSLAMRTAEVIAPNLAPNQISVVLGVLRGLVNESQEQSRFDRFEKLQSAGGSTTKRGKM